MPTLTPADIHNMNRDPITQPYVMLIEAEEQWSGIVHRYCLDNAPVMSNGEEYTPIALEFDVPGKGEEQTPVTLSMSNVDREAGKALLSADKRLLLRMMAVDMADPDTYLIDTLDLFFLADSQINAQSVEGTVGPVIDWLTPVPFQKTTENLFPGVWA